MLSWVCALPRRSSRNNSLPAMAGSDHTMLGARCASCRRPSASTDRGVDGPAPPCHHVCCRRTLTDEVEPQCWRRHAAPLPRSPLPLRPPPPRDSCRRVYSRFYSHRVVAALATVVALATAPRSLPPRACRPQCAATLSIVVPLCQQFPCAHATTSGIIAPSRALADIVAPPRLALSHHRVRSR